MKLLYGDFSEGSMVLVEIDGKQYHRKVQYDSEAGDLYIIAKNYIWYLNQVEW